MELQECFGDHNGTFLGWFQELCCALCWLVSARRQPVNLHDFLGLDDVHDLLYCCNFRDDPDSCDRRRHLYLDFILRARVNFLFLRCISHLLQRGGHFADLCLLRAERQYLLRVLECFAQWVSIRPGIERHLLHGSCRLAFGQRGLHFSTLLKLTAFRRLISEESQR